jgi:hypothetical protein
MMTMTMAMMMKMKMVGDEDDEREDAECEEAGGEVRLNEVRVQVEVNEESR